MFAASPPSTVIQKVVLLTALTHDALDEIDRPYGISSGGDPQSVSRRRLASHWQGDLPAFRKLKPCNATHATEFIQRSFLSTDDDGVDAIYVHHYSNWDEGEDVEQHKLTEQRAPEIAKMRARSLSDAAGSTTTTHNFSRRGAAASICSTRWSRPSTSHSAASRALTERWATGATRRFGCQR